VIKLRLWETYYWKKANKLVAVSDEDKKVMQKLIPGINVDVIPNGVDANYFAKQRVLKKEPPRIMYGVTNFEWLQNVEAVDTLINDVWPNIKKEYSDAKLWIVGRLIPQRLVQLSKENPDIEITESIADARDAYQGASIMVTPIKGSGGTRLKILEAMAAGLPIVSTSIGVAGLNLTNGRHAIIADDSKMLAEETVKLLKNPKLAEKIGKAGQEFVSKRYDWKMIVQIHDRIYDELTSK
jgi:glycosyltransferase involved in cell wall biosynthesis